MRAQSLFPTGSQGLLVLQPQDHTVVMRGWVIHVIHHKTDVPLGFSYRRQLLLMPTEQEHLYPQARVARRACERSELEEALETSTLLYI